MNKHKNQKVARETNSIKFPEPTDENDELVILGVVVLLGLVIAHATRSSGHNRRNNRGTRSGSCTSSFREFALCKLTLSSDPRVWMGGGIPTRWRWQSQDDRDRRRVSKSGVVHCVSYSKNDHFSIFLQRNTMKLWGKGSGQKHAFM